MNVAQLIAEKRDGAEHATESIQFLVNGFAAGAVPDYQMSAWAMAVFFQGMSFRETLDLTRAMRDSGDVLSWPIGGRPKVDKHSTGGVGDKISIPLAPALAACGVDIPMISGRGLGTTGGTLDKLESIAGYRCDLTLKEFVSVVERIGCVISGATANIAPADQKLYALRDVTATVPAIPLITASILSKKLAAGLDALVLDVKWGTGAFMKSLDRARELATTLVSVASELGTPTTAILTDMNQPIGQMVGNAVEIMESLEILDGGGPADVRELTCLFGGQLLVDAGIVNSGDAGQNLIAQQLDDGSARTKFEQMVSAQGGELRQVASPSKSQPLFAVGEGILTGIDCALIGRALIELGGGRTKIGQAIDHAVGFQIHCCIGDAISRSQPLVTVYYDKPIPESVRQSLLGAFILGGKSPKPLALVVETVSATH